jgi:hypothetical protein
MRAFENMTTVLIVGCWLTSQTAPFPPVGQQYRGGAMLDVRAAALRTGIVGGVLFFLHASIPGSLSYPFVWPALAGAVAFWIATDAVAPHQFRRGMSAALAAGTLAGLIMFVGVTLAILILGRPVLSSLTPAPSAAGMLLIAGSTEFAIAIVGLVGVGAAVVGGAAMMLVRRLRPSRANGPAA